MTEPTRRPSAALIVAILALVVALTGSAYAAVNLPRNSVGSVQIKKNAVTTSDIKNKTIGPKDIDGGLLGKLQVKEAGNAPTTITAPLASTGTPVGSVAMSRGIWQVRAIVYVINDSAAQPAEPRCNLKSGGSVLAEGLPGYYLLIPPLAGNNPSRAQFSLEITVKAGKSGALAQVTCTEGAAIQNFRVGTSLTALQVVQPDIQ